MISTDAPRAVFSQIRQNAEKDGHEPSHVLMVTVPIVPPKKEEEKRREDKRDRAEKEAEEARNPLPIFNRVLEYDDIHRQSYIQVLRRDHHASETSHNARTALEDVTWAFRWYVTSRREDEQAAQHEIDAAVRAFEGQMQRCLASVYRYDGLNDEWQSDFMAYAQDKARQLIEGSGRIRRAYRLSEKTLARGREEDRYLEEVWLPQKVEEYWEYYQKRLLGTVPRYVEGHPVQDDLMRDQDTLRQESLSRWQRGNHAALVENIEEAGHTLLQTDEKKDCSAVPLFASRKHQQ